MSKPYHSFLFCAHPDRVDVYVTGVQLGVIRDGTFQLRQVLQADGSRRDLTVADLNQAGLPCPFKSLAEVGNEVGKLAAQLWPIRNTTTDPGFGTHVREAIAVVKDWVGDLPRGDDD
jgi:hypothetical protein